MSNRQRRMFRVEVFLGGRRVKQAWYSLTTPRLAYKTAVDFLFMLHVDYVCVSLDSKLLARMVRP